MSHGGVPSYLVSSRGFRGSCNRNERNPVARATIGQIKPHWVVSVEGVEFGGCSVDLYIFVYVIFFVYIVK